MKNLLNLLWAIVGLIWVVHGFQSGESCNTAIGLLFVMHAGRSE